MKKLLCLALLAVCACGKTPPAFQEVKLEDGKPGFIVDCHDMDEEECLTYTHKVCHRGNFNFLHRNVANHPNFLLISCQ